MYQAGVQIWQTNGLTTTNMALNVKFVANIAGSTASFSGIDIIPAGSAKCALKTNITGLPNSAFTTFQFALKPNIVYSINCQLSSNAKVDGTYTNIYIYNTVSGAFNTVLFNKVSANQLTAMANQASALKSQVGLIGLIPG